MADAILATSKSFNPRSRAGSDPIYHQQYIRLEVSIHAPVRGATKSFCRDKIGIRVSIHAPVRGATILAVAVPRDIGVSIHAPVRGATRRRKIRRG